MNGKVRAIIIVVIVLVILGMTAGYVHRKYQQYMEEYQGTESYEGEDVVIEIPKGSAVKTIAGILQDNGLITFKAAFINRVKESEYRGKLQYGTFTLNTGMSTLEMIKVLAGSGQEAVWQTLTVPEGYSAEMIGARLEEQGICTSSEFLAALNKEDYDYEFLNTIPDNNNLKYDLQGFLFPATYNITESDTPADIVNKMLAKFNEIYTAEYKSKEQELGYTTFEVVNRAAIVEREAKLEEERATIAGVINNRLAIDMKLQMCPTVLYPLTNGMYDVAQVTYADLEIDSPYNTYMYPGLTVGPICNPGAASLYAVLNPETHEYLYYHTDDATVGNHIFSKTYEEHQSTLQTGGETGEGTVTNDGVVESGGGENITEPATTTTAE